MNIWVELGAEGAARAAGRGDMVIVVDALRASVTITAGLAVGARTVIPVVTVEEATAYEGRPGYLLAGERHSLPVPGFDFGNSPTELLHHAQEIVGNTLVLTTSHGTRCVDAAREGACAVLVGSLPNASTVARIAHAGARLQGCDITLVAAGIADGSRAEEDDYAVALLAGMLAELGAETRQAAPSGPAEAAFQEGRHGQRLIGLGYGPDVELCASLDVFEIAGVLAQEGFYAMGAKT